MKFIKNLLIIEIIILLIIKYTIKKLMAKNTYIYLIIEINMVVTQPPETK
jgi:hypothetical protein